MKHILIILLSIVSVTVYSQSPRIKLNQIVKDNAKGSILISSPTDSQMVYSRDFFINFGADTTLVLFGDTIGGGISTVVTDLVTIQGDGSVSTPLYVDTSVINTIKGMVDTLTARGYLTTEVDGSTTNEIQTLSKAGQTVSLSLSGGSFTDDVLTESEVDAFVANNGYLTAEVDGSVTNELQTISTDNTAGNITLSNSGGTLTLNVNDADADATNEGSLTVQAGGANDSEIQSNTSGSSNVVIAGGSNVTVTESGQTITIASTATGGGGSIPVDTFVTIAGTDTITGAKTFSQKIDINKSTQGEYFRGAASSQGFYLNMTSTSNSFNGDKHIINADGFSGEIALSSDGTEILTISSDDKVGIMNNGPGANLDVRATGSGNDNAFLVSGLIGQNLLEVDTDGDLIVDTSTLYVDATNNRVGIGTAIPSADFQVDADSAIAVDATNNRLHINGTYDYSFLSTLRAKIEINGTENSAAFRYKGGFVNETNDFGSVSKSTSTINKRIQYIFYDRDNVQTGKFGVDVKGLNDDDFQIVAGSGSTPQFSLEANGNLGINNLSPNVALDVVGSIEYTGTITDVSDERLKINKEPLVGVTSQLMRLNPIKYNQLVLDNNSLGVPEYGLTAQNVREVFPEMVTTVQQKDGVDYLGLSYIQLISPLIKGFQEQQAIIETQEQKITDLQTTIQALITRIENLENK